MGGEPARPTGYVPFTKDDIINNGPKFYSIGYRFRTENQNKYVAQNRSPNLASHQSRYPPPYKRILLSKNPKDRIGNGIGLRITGGQAMPTLYDKINGCIVTSGAFVTQVFQNSSVYFMGEITEGDQIIEWNGVNLCNRSDQEVQQILLSQFSDDEVEIIYLKRDQLAEVYSQVDEMEPAGVHSAAYQQQVADELAPGEANYVLGEALAVGAGRVGLGMSRFGGSIRRKLSLSSFANIWSK